MTTTLYNLRTQTNVYRITKFTDGEVESSYLTTLETCDCPAGHRPICRHRQMLRIMLADGICDTEWFFNYNKLQSVDFDGNAKPSLGPTSPDPNWRRI